MAVVGQGSASAMPRREKTDFETHILRDLGQRFQRARESRGWTLQDVAARVTQLGQFSLSPTGLHYIEEGKVAAQLPKLLHLAAVLDMPDLLTLHPCAPLTVRRDIVQLLPEIDETFLRLVLRLLKSYRGKKPRQSP